jgi:Flp pilus assembly pilin Flp
VKTQQTKEPFTMSTLNKWIWEARIWRDSRGQDLIEYALMGGFIAVAAASIMPGVANSVSTIFSKVASLATKSATQGS